MRKKILTSIGVVIFCISLTGCQSVTKSFGGNTTIKLEANRKLEEITWKDNSLWYLTRPMRDNAQPETHVFEESSNTGILEGTVTVIESDDNEK